MTKLVIYNNDTETIIGALSDDAALINDYFTTGGRDLADYERIESNGPCKVIALNQVRES